MINFPLFKHLSVIGFGLYPGLDKATPTGLHIDFLDGLTLILGANGLGKTTLVNILYRLLTGPYDIPRLVDRPELGNLKLEAKGLNKYEQGLFSKRVVDGAAGALALLRVQVGPHELLIERSLHNLALTRFEIDGSDAGTDEVGAYQQQIRGLTGTSSFGDWILLLRHLVFYFEDRRALVWDPSAQKEILRILYLSTDVSKRWLEDSRDVLELDSRTRNLNAALGKEERSLSSSEAKTEAGAASLQQLRALEAVQQVEEAKLEQLQDEFANIAAHRQEYRVILLTAEQQQESASRAVERLKLAAITASFPQLSETMRFILSHLFVEDQCLACGNQAHEAAQNYVARLNEQQCVVCATPLPTAASNGTEDEYQQSLLALRKSDQNLLASRAKNEEVEREYQRYVRDTTALEGSMYRRSAEIDALLKALPPQEEQMHAQRGQLAVLRTRLAELKESLTEKRQRYGEFVAEASRNIAVNASPIKDAFDRYAEGFLLEQCRLIWAPQKLRLGESGEAIDFPAFNLEMSGANFESPVRRSGPEQVSESQREFIDLAFRMAMMEVAGSQVGSSLVIDAPESSLDAVFVTRAAQVLTRFANPHRTNRLVITSNLVEGQLIPHLISTSTLDSNLQQRVVDLFALARAHGSR